MNKTKTDKKDIKQNIAWFRKFSLEDRFRIAEIDRESIEILRGLSIKKGYGKSKRAD